MLNFSAEVKKFETSSSFSLHPLRTDFEISVENLLENSFLDTLETLESNCNKVPARHFVVFSVTKL